jgi:hypothetical protein
MHATPQQRQVPPDTDDVAIVREIAAAILDAFVPDTPLELVDVVRLRSATRRVLEAHLPPEDEDRLLAGLARRAARSPLPLWALAAMEAELLEPEPPDLLPVDVVGRARTLRQWGTRPVRPARGRSPPRPRSTATPGAGSGRPRTETFVAAPSRMGWPHEWKRVPTRRVRESSS